jgi:hypothetical protein
LYQLYPKNSHLHPVYGAAIADRIFADAVLNGDFRNGNLMIGRDGVRAVVETWAGSASIPGATAAWRRSSIALATREDRP